MTTLQTGALLHQQRYRIRQPLGRGGMGAVYLAEDLNLAGRLVAVKENLNNSEEAQRQFRREAVLLAHLRHPGLPQVIDYFLDESGRQYLVMEYVPGENMQEALASNGALPMAEALTCMDQVMQAVAYMHRQRDPESGRPRAVIHRDIKPANIKRTPEGRYVLVDFGIAKVQSLTAAATAVSARALTPGYAPIEQYHGGTDERSDVYALGATLYALVTGKAPPSATNMAAGAPLPPPRSYNSKVPAAVSKVIERAMRMAVQDRYQRVTEMYAALFNRPMPTAPGATAPAVSSARRQPNRSAALVVGAVVVGTVLALWVLLATSTTDDTSAGRPAPPATVPALVGVPATDGATTATAPSTDESAAAPVDTPTAKPAAPGVAQAGVELPPAAAGATTAVAPTATSLAQTPDTAAAQDESTPTETPMSTTSNATMTVVAATQAIPIGEIGGAQRTSAPTSTPLPTSTTVSTPAPTLTRPPPPPTTGAPRTPTAAASVGVAGGPQIASINQPADNASSNNPITFSWRSDADLAPGQEYEVVFWNPQNQTAAQGGGWVRSSPATSIQIPADRKPPGTYSWALFLVRPEPYERLRMLAGPFTFSIPGGGGESRPGPNPPEPEPTKATDL